MKKQNVRTLSFIVGSFTYLLMGAAIFESLESETEDKGYHDVRKTMLYFKNQYNISNDELDEFENMVVRYHSYHNFPQWYLNLNLL
jgi:potassium channel subfamily K protein 9